MKKLLTLAVIAVTTGIAQAASLSWMASQVYQSGTTTPVSGGLVYLFITEQSKDFGAGVTSVDDVIAFIKGGATVVTDETSGKATALKKGEDQIGIAAEGATNTSGGFSGATGFYENFAAGDSLKAFAVVFDAATLATAENFIVTAEKEASWTSSAGAKTLLFGTQKDATWVAVPEPSVALMGLLGLGMLLKRRKA